jgi:hypothetical protein
MWALLNEDHFSKYLETKNLERSSESLQMFLKEIGTFSFFFQKPTGSNYTEVPSSTCIRFRTTDDYINTVKTVLYQKKTKIERSNSCSIV